MKWIPAVMAIWFLVSCSQPAPEPNAGYEARLNELESSLAELEQRFPAKAKPANGLPRPDGTCQYEPKCTPYQCCTWQGGICWCDMCCYTIKPEFKTEEQGASELNCDG